MCGRYLCVCVLLRRVVANTGGNDLIKSLTVKPVVNHRVIGLY